MKKFAYFPCLLLLAMLPQHHRKIFSSGGSTVAISQHGPAALTSCHTTAAASLTCNPGTITSVSNMLAVVDVGLGNSPAATTVSSVTWCSSTGGGGTCTAMNAVHAITCQAANTLCTQQFTLAAPATGTTSFVITLSGTETFDIWVEASTYSGVNQTTPVRASSFGSCANTSTTSCAITMTSATGDLTTSVVIAVWSGTYSTTQTLIILDDTHGSRTGFALDYATGASSVTSTWSTTGGAAANAGCGFSIEHA